MNTYLTKCACGRTTSRSYAKKHNGKCKACADPENFMQQERRTAMIIDHGYDAYAREEGHYDLPDWA